MEKDFTSKHIPALDGLRGLAILWVIFHNGALDSALNTQQLSGKILALISSTGWLGVQLFFVLSGFLITGILLDAKKRRASNLFRNFYMRRALRIFPIYYLFLGICFFAAAYLNNPPSWLSNAYEYKWWHIFYLNNWILPFSNIGLSHLWSLAIEEQFYLFWPIVILLTPNRFIYHVCGSLIITSLLYRVTITSIDIEFAKLGAYVPTIARVDALAIGSLLALMVRGHKLQFHRQKYINYTLLISSSYLIYILLTQHNIARVTEGLYNLNQTMSALFFASMVYYATKFESKKKLYNLYLWLLETQALRSIGKYSYAMYLFHWPISLVLHEHISFKLLQSVDYYDENILIVLFLVDMLVVISISYIAAWFSWMLVESKFLNLKRHYL